MRFSAKNASQIGLDKTTHAQCAAKINLKCNSSVTIRIWLDYWKQWSFIASIRTEAAQILYHSISMRLIKETVESARCVMKKLYSKISLSTFQTTVRITYWNVHIVLLRCPGSKCSSTDVTRCFVDLKRMDLIITSTKAELQTSMISKTTSINLSALFAQT